MKALSKVTKFNITQSKSNKGFKKKFIQVNGQSKDRLDLELLINEIKIFYHEEFKSKIKLFPPLPVQL